MTSPSHQKTILLVKTHLPTFQTQMQLRTQDISYLHDQSGITDDNNGEPPFTNIFTSYGPVKYMVNCVKHPPSKNMVLQIVGRICRVDKPVQIIVNSSSLRESWVSYLSSNFYSSLSSSPSTSPLSSNEQHVDNTVVALQEYDND